MNTEIDIPKKKKDNIRNLWGVTDNGKPFPIDIYDQYEYRNGKLKKQYSQKDILGTWYGYGHLYDNRTTLILNEDGSYKLVREEAKLTFNLLSSEERVSGRDGRRLSR